MLNHGRLGSFLLGLKLKYRDSRNKVTCEQKHGEEQAR